MKMSNTVMRALGLAAVLVSVTATACDLNKALSVQPANLIDAVSLESSPANANLLVNGAAGDFDCAFGSYVVVGALIGEEFEDGLQTADRWPYDQRTVTANLSRYSQNSCTALGVYTVGRVEHLLQRARLHGIPTASHDDDSVHRIAAMRALGVAMSEFPITLDTAKAAVSCGLPTILGAPNVLRGQSQSGSMRAIDAIRAGVASCLCSDYQPSTLIAAAFVAARQASLPLPQAMALVTANPAAAAEAGAGDALRKKRFFLARKNQGTFIRSRFARGPTPAARCARAARRAGSSPASPRRHARARCRG